MNKEASILEDFNPWWQDGALPEENQFPRRQYYSNLESLVLKGRKGRVTVLVGLRRTGKTIMLKQLVATAIAEGFYKPKQVVFVSGVASDFAQRTILDLTHSIRERFQQDENWLLLLDEVQFFKDWKRDLTYIADHLPRVKCVASGSSATVLNLWKQQTETGLGRILDLHLPPLLFCEYLRLIDSWPSQLGEDFHSIVNARLNQSMLAKLNQDFIDYINFGAFPQLAYARREKDLAAAFEILAKEIRLNVITAYIDMELPQLLGVRDKEMLHNLGKYIISNPLTVYSQKNYMEHLKISQPTLIRYLEFMTGAYFMRVLRKIDGGRNILKHQRTHCKFFLENCSLPSLILRPIEEFSMGIGKRVENAVLSQFSPATSLEEYGYLKCLRPRKGSFEIDLCHLDPQGWPLMLAEMKWTDDSNDYKKTDRSMAYLIKQWGKKKKISPELYCTSRTLYEPGIEFASNLILLPAAQFSLALGMQRIQDAPK